MKKYSKIYDIYIKESFANFIIKLLLIFFILQIYVLFPVDNLLFVSTNFIIIFLSIFGIFSDENKPYTLKKMYFLFNFYMYGIISYFEIFYNIEYWGVDFLTIDDFIFTNIIIILSNLFFLLFYNIGSLKFKANPKISKLLINNFSLKHKIFINLFLLSLFFIVIVLIIFLIKGEWIRLFVRMGPAYNSQIIFLFFSYVLKPLPLIIFMFLFSINCRLDRCGLKKKILLLFVFIFSILFMFPTSVARFLSISLYLALLLLMIDIIKRKYIIQISSLMGLFVVFPFLDKFRHFNETNFSWKMNFNFIFQGHFDAYQNLTIILKKDFITYGYQLLGSILFYIPRSIWNDKPIGSGSQIAEKFGLTFNNISMPFIAEGYINFGIIGILIFSFILGIGCSYLDKIYWGLEKNKNFNLIYIFYFLSLGLILFLLRGDLLSSFAYISTILMIVLVIIKSINIINRIKV